MSEAIRHPARGKAHRPAPDVDLLGTYSGTGCRLRRDSVKGFTEVVPLTRTAPEDRCRRCFPDTLATTPESR